MMKMKLIFIYFAFVSCSELRTAKMSMDEGKLKNEILKKEPLNLESMALKNLQEDPLGAISQLNLGLTYEIQKKHAEAVNIYDSVLQSDAVDSMKFYAAFNKAQALAQLKNVDAALENYQVALKYNPQSIETKTNIELLIQQQQSEQNSQGGESENKDDQNQQGNDQQQDQKDSDNNKEDKEEKEKKESEKPKNYQPSSKYKPRDFKGEISEDQVKKILGELRQQEQKIREKYQNQEMKESPREKDW